MPHFSGCLASTVCRKGEILLATVTNSQQVFLLTVCQNHRQGTWDATSHHSSFTLEVTMRNTSLRVSLPAWAESLQSTGSGHQCKESVWAMGRIAQDTQSPCDEHSKSSYISPQQYSLSHPAHLPPVWHATWRVLSPRERQEDEKQQLVRRSDTKEEADIDKKEENKLKRKQS